MATEIDHDYRKREEEAAREHHEKVQAAKGIKPGDWQYNFSTGGELYEGKHPQDNDVWGPWRFQQSNLTLQLEGKYAHFHREIDLEELGSPVEVMNWLGHYLEKNWGNADVMGHLLTALYDLAFHTYWGDPNVNLSETIQKRYGKVTA
jgi:hypothetical protein